MLIRRKNMLLYAEAKILLIWHSGDHTAVEVANRNNRRLDSLLGSPHLTPIIVIVRDTYMNLE